MFDTFQKILELLTPNEKRKAFLILFLVMIMALLETVGVASILPFLAVLGDPATVHENAYLSRIYALSGFDDLHQFLILLGVLAFLVILFSSAFRVLTIFVLNRFVCMRRHSLSERLLGAYLRQPYAFFLRRHSGDMANKILSETDLVIGNALQPCMNIAAYFVVVLALILLLVFTNPILAVSVGMTIGSMYVLVYLCIRKLMGRIGIELTHANSERFTAASESLGGIKAIKILGREQAYLGRFQPASKRFASCQSTSASVAEVPKHVIEAIGIGGILILAITLMATKNSVGSVLPVLGLYAFAGYKLIPASQRIYDAVSRLRFGKATVESVYEDLIKNKHNIKDKHSIKDKQRNELPEVNRLSFSKEIVIDGLNYAYSEDTAPVLSAINLKIPMGTSAAIVGTTGAGKTTLLDIILGLLAPTKGHLSVDGVNITDENVRAWQNSIGYVPQEIFLTDSTISENIALGIPIENIDQQQVERCAKLAQLHQFVIEELPEQYQTEVGERGVRLSGGQRQRIGIARALYLNPPVLIFDEATSALDNQTEQDLMQSIRGLSEYKTIIMVAHRLTTVQYCDQIILLDKGEIKDAGDYKSLEIRQPAFFAKGDGLEKVAQ